MSRPDPAAWTCPPSLARHDRVQLAHGGGGRLSADLIASIFLPAFSHPAGTPLHDGAMLSLPPGRVAFTTDSFVVSPLFFPGGDIGSLAVHGTVNDLSMCGATPLHLSAAFILEEGLPFTTLASVAASMGAAARHAGVSVVTGDTKVVERGKADGVFINTSGVGVIPAGVDISPARVRPGDVILLSGDLAAHGVAILSVRHGLQFSTTVRSDSAPLHALVRAGLEAAGAEIHVLRDPTRGGVASALHELAEAAAVTMELDETTLPVADEVRGACELLGLDPLYVANEGVCLAVVAPAHADAVLTAWRAHPLGVRAAAVGTVREGAAGVLLRTRLGTRRVVDRLSGEQLPRIC